MPLPLPSWAVLAAYLRCRSLPERRADVVYRQQFRLRRLLRYVGQRSPYWREVLRHRPPRLAELPILDVEEAAATFDRLNTVGLRRRDVLSALRGGRAARVRRVRVGPWVVREGPGGVLVADVRERSLHLGAVLARLLPTPLFTARQDRVALLGRSPVALPQFIELVGPNRLRCLGVPRCEPLPVQLAQLRDLAPTVIVGSLARLRPVAERWADLGPVRPVHHVVSMVEGVTPEAAEALQHGFQVGQVHRVYRADEGLYGQTCAYGRVHLNEDLAIIERAWVDRQARIYRPIVTDLFRTTLPRIRTKLADVLTESVGPCPCGSVLRSVDRIERIDAAHAA